MGGWGGVGGAEEGGWAAISHKKRCRTDATEPSQRSLSLKGGGTEGKGQPSPRRRETPHTP